MDSESTVHVFSNKELVNNIRDSSTRFNTHCNAGTKATHQKEEELWFDPTFIANILSLSKITEKYRVTFDDSKDKNEFVIHKDNDNALMRFIKGP